MKIVIKVLQGPECSIQVPSDASIQQVKQQVERQLGIPVLEQKIVHQGKPLADSTLLNTTNIKDGAKLFLVADKAAISAATALVALSSSSSGAHTQCPASQAMWTEMHTFLKRHFTEQDAVKVLEEYKKEFTMNMNSLSLEDIERLTAMKSGATKV